MFFSKRAFVIIRIVCITAVCLSTASAQEHGSPDYWDMSLEDLLEVKIVTAGKTEQKVADIPASVVVITRQDIERNGYQTLYEALSHIPGIYMIDNYVDKTFGMRGFVSSSLSENFILLVNGVSQLNNVSYSSPLFRVFAPIESVDRIEVVRGPMSVMYGSGAFFGAINIITNRALDENESEILSASYGSMTTHRVFFRAAENNEDLNICVNASTFHTDGIDEPYSKMIPADSLEILEGPLEAGGINLPKGQTTGGFLEKSSRYFNVSGKFQEYYFDLTYHESFNETYQNVPASKDGTDTREKLTGGVVGYRREVSGNMTLDGKVVYVGNQVYTNFDAAFDDFYGTEEADNMMIGAELNSFLRPTPTLDVSLGISYHSLVSARNRTHVPLVGLNNYRFFLADGDDMVNRAGFVQAVYAPIPKIKLVGGFRMEQISEYRLHAEKNNDGSPFNPDFQKIDLTIEESEWEATPRFALIYAKNAHQVVKLLYGEALKQPSYSKNIEHMTTLFDPDAEESVKPLKSENISALEINFLLSYPKFNSSLSLFRNSLKNLITKTLEFSPSTDGTFIIYIVNGGELETVGIEATASTEFIDNFYMSLSGTYQKTDDKKQENIDVAYSPKFLGYFDLSYRYRWASLALTGNYVDEMESYYDPYFENEGGTTGNRIGDKVDGYFLLGTNMRIDGIYKGIYLNVRCSNLLDQEIRYPVSSDNNYLLKGTLGKSRSVLAIVGMKF
ncbi:MAG: hypothetical protein B6244_10490 [Candidatus Cloacimonetes bacterium 4572_55]|nr:MAG: hypothetical protein B6244_10490 [Candidatus Cloacimonetes bacterium 4572_55]